MFRFPLVRCAAVPACTAAGLAIGIATAVAVSAGSTASSTPSTFRRTCVEVRACVAIRNDGKGPGAIGTTTFNEDTNAEGTQLPSRAGLIGNDISSAPLNSNAGVLGTSRNGTGVAGITTFNGAKSNNRLGQNGVAGLDNSTTVNQNDGVAGLSYRNVGVFGASFDSKVGIGIVGKNDGDIGVLGISGAGGSGIFGFNSGSGNALNGFSTAPADATLVVNNAGGGPVIHAYGGAMGQTQILNLDNAGNLTIAGKLTQNETPAATSATSTGQRVVTYSSQQSTRTMEDVGEAQLVHGQAVVRFDAAFSSVINTARRYLVFVTPQGKTSGLYVAQKSAAGFTVRENDAASNIAFDYRIVAQPYGPTSQRLPAYAPQNDSAAAAAELRMVQRARSFRTPHVRP